MAEKYTPNKPKDAGLEARQKLGWWHAYRFLILRRISQLSAFGYCAIDRSIDYR